MISSIISKRQIKFDFLGRFRKEEIMDKKELNIFGRYLYKGYFEEDLDIPIEVNNRLKRTHA